MKKRGLATSAFRFVLIIGVANLFADMTYEGARSVTGPFLGSLGASATVVGFVAGFGELIGYSFRSVSGYLADKSAKYWIVTFVGLSDQHACRPSACSCRQLAACGGIDRCGTSWQSYPATSR
jgi:hypothetical protein